MTIKQEFLIDSIMRTLRTWIRRQQFGYTFLHPMDVDQLEEWANDLSSVYDQVYDESRTPRKDLETFTVSTETATDTPQQRSECLKMNYPNSR